MIYIAVLVIILIVLGDSQPKIALAIAALILFGAILLNKDIFSSLLGGGSAYNKGTGFGGFGGDGTGGLYYGGGGTGSSGGGRN